MIYSLHSDANYHNYMPIFITIIIFLKINNYRKRAVHIRSKHPDRTVSDAPCQPCRPQHVGRATLVAPWRRTVSAIIWLPEPREIRVNATQHSLNEFCVSNFIFLLDLKNNGSVQCGHDIAIRKFN